MNTNFEGDLPPKLEVSNVHFLSESEKYKQKNSWSLRIWSFLKMHNFYKRFVKFTRLALKYEILMKSLEISWTSKNPMRFWRIDRPLWKVHWGSILAKGVKKMNKLLFFGYTEPNKFRGKDGIFSKFRFLLKIEPTFWGRPRIQEEAAGRAKEAEGDGRQSRTEGTPV